jgi:hypothetical protein
MRWLGRVEHIGEMRNAYKMLVGKSEGKRPLGRSRHKWEENIRMDLREVGWEFMNCKHLGLNRDHWQAFVNTVMNLWVP